MFVAQWLRPMWDAIAPLHCAGCDTIGHLLCPTCQVRVGRLVGPVAQVSRDHDHARAVQVRSAYAYEPPVRGIIARAKYGDARSALRQLARLASARLAARGVPPLLVPVPLDAQRRRHRGFNQAELIAQEWGDEWEVAIDRRLLRVRHSARQVGADVGQRRANVESAFAWPDGVHVPPRVTLIDDVITTGATLLAAAAPFQASGSVVDAITIAATDL